MDLGEREVWREFKGVEGQKNLFSIKKIFGGGSFFYKVFNKIQKLKLSPICNYKDMQWVLD